MAEVFRAVMPGAGGFRRTLVVKRIHPQFSGAASFVEMFVKEAQICALLNHPNIVAVSDFGQIEGSYFLAMEYLRGRNLQAVMRRLRERHDACPVAVAAFIAREVASGLAYAHELTSPDGKPLNIVHRDVSPSNIMCSPTGGVKLLDFGIAKALGEGDEDGKEEVSFKGKLSYTAPERLRQEPADARADLFSLGVVLWEMLVGKRLFRGGSDVDTMTNVMDAPVAAPSSLRPEVPPELDAIVLRALARDPAARYQSAHEIADELETVLVAARYQSRMLPTLLHDLFGSSLKTGQLPVQWEEELAAMNDGASYQTSARETSVKGEVSAEVTAPRRSVARWAVALTSAVAALGGLVSWGLGGRAARPPVAPAAVSHASAPSRVAPPSPTAPSMPSQPAIVAPVIAPVLAPARSALAEAPPPKPSPTRKVESPLPVRPEAGPRTAQARIRAERTRIARGLSIDPFADAERAKK